MAKTASDTAIVAKAPRTPRKPYVQYAPAIAEQIFALMVEGHTARQIAKMPGMPGITTIFNWRRDHPGFETGYLKARDLRAELMLDQIIEIADDQSVGVQRSALMVDARKWVFAQSKMAATGTLLIEGLGIKVEFVAPRPAE